MLFGQYFRFYIYFNIWVKIEKPGNIYGKHDFYRFHFCFLRYQTRLKCIRIVSNFHTLLRWVEYERGINLKIFRPLFKLNIKI